jgi:TolB protein
MDINEKLKLPSIKWMDRLVVFARYVGAKQSQILISDYTLTYKKVIIQGGLNLFPKWANKDQNAFYYTAYDNGLPTLYKYDLYSASKTKLTSSPGMLVCSDVSSDGLKLLLTMTTNDQPDIYLYDVVSGQKRRITSFKGIEVNGSFVDNEQKVVFVSDALGYPNIFAVNIDGSGFEQMVFHGKNNNTCSTSGKYIVYSSREGSSEFGRNVFNLYLMSTTSDYVRKLTATGKNLYPRFANDGETVMFIKEFQRQSALGVIRLNANRSYLFPLKVGKIQSLDW